MTDADVIASIRRGTHVLVPAHDDWTITKIEDDPDAVAALEINIATVEQARALTVALWAAADARKE